LNALQRVEALFLSLASILEAHYLNRQKVVMCALKAVPKAKSREERAIHITTIFFWFFSYEKEKNEKHISLPLF